MNVLVIAPHRDDEVLGVGGTIAWHVAKGDAVTICTVTTGIEEQFGHDAIARVHTESLSAHKLLGVVRDSYLNLPAVHLDAYPQAELNEALSKETSGADVVYLPSPTDINDDHKRIFNAGLVACRPDPHSHVRTVLCYETMSETEWGSWAGAIPFVPDWFIDITPFLETKLRAMQCYVSQLQSAPNARSLASLRALATLRGHTIGVQYAEAFQLVRQVWYLNKP